MIREKQFAAASGWLVLGVLLAAIAVLVVVTIGGVRAQDPLRIV